MGAVKASVIDAMCDAQDLGGCALVYLMARGYSAAAVRVAHGLGVIECGCAACAARWVECGPSCSAPSCMRCDATGRVCATCDKSPRVCPGHDAADGPRGCPGDEQAAPGPRECGEVAA